MEEIVDERAELPAFLYGQLLRERALLHRLAAKHFVNPQSSVDVSMEPGEKPNRWQMVFRGSNAKGKSFKVTLEVYKRGRSRWLMTTPRVFVDEVEDESFEGGLEEALAAALGGSAGKVGETLGPSCDGHPELGGT
jgi:predicted ATPase